MNKIPVLDNPANRLIMCEEVLVILKKHFKHPTRPAYLCYRFCDTDFYKNSLINVTFSGIKMEWEIPNYFYLCDVFPELIRPKYRVRGLWGLSTDYKLRIDIIENAIIAVKKLIHDTN